MADILSNQFGLNCPRVCSHQVAKGLGSKGFQGLSLNIFDEPDHAQDICEKLNLQVRGIHGEHSESEGGVFDISNKARLGKKLSRC